MTESRSIAQILIFEVSPRDGFQNEKRVLETERKISFINTLSGIGFRKIEVSSFVSPAAVPQLKDADEVFRRINRMNGVIYTGLVPNARGVERALSARLDEVNFVSSVSETHNQANLGMSCSRSFESLKQVASLLKGTNIKLNATAATAFGCPFEGDQPAEKALIHLSKYIEAGANSVTMADTIGSANPCQVEALVSRFQREFSDVRLTLHFHNTRGMALANILCAYQLGVVQFDAALGGIGGCPFAPGATGNVSTEDVAHMFESMAIPTGLDFDALLSAGRMLPSMLGHDVPSHVLRAGPSWALNSPK